MAIVTNEPEFKNAISNMEAEIIIANDISLTSITNINYGVTIIGQTGVSIIWNGTGVTNRTMLAVTDPGNLVIESLTLDGDGRDVTLVLVNGGSFTMNEGAVLQNTSGISAQNAVKVTSNGVFIMNSGLITGIDTTDAVYSSPGTVTMNNDAAISENMAAGITLSRSTLTMTGLSHISNNQGKQTGGAGVIVNSNIIMGVYEGDAPYVSGNRTDYTSGAWFLSNGSTLTMRYGAEISDNFANGLAGGVRAQQTTISMRENASIKNNTSNSDGGGLYMSTDCTAVLDDYAQVSGNTAIGRGGGIYAQNGAILQIKGHAAVHHNTGENGAGIYLNASSAFIGIEDSSPTINNNNSTVNGGGIYVSATSVLEITGSSSIINNSAANGDGGGIFTEDTATYANFSTGSGTLFHGNRAINAYVPPTDASSLYPNIQFASTSIADHPLNNYDINYTGGELLTYHVEYNANGGIGSYTGPSITPGDTDIVLSPEATGISRPGYAFTGWNTAPDGSGIAYAPGSLITVNANITLYAQWIAYALYSITYNANGGCGSHVDTGIASGTQYTVLSPEQAAISRPGYTFTGWNTEPNGSGRAYAPGNSIIITGSVILFAQWEVQTTCCIPCNCRCCIPCTCRCCTPCCRCQCKQR
ncbi:MAG: InlB B-repeat-containing protein [Lachnospiraceae bacterium]